MATTSAFDPSKIGAVCHTCGRSDFLPFTCNYCGLKYCQDHRHPQSHTCGPYSALQKEQALKTGSSTPPPAIGSIKTTCSHTQCSTALDGIMSPGTVCKCRGIFCLKHRHPLDHACKYTSPPPTSAARAREALEKLRHWASSYGSTRTDAGKKTSTKTSRVLVVAKMKKTSKGDQRVPQEKRIYIHAEGPPDEPNQPKADIYVSREWSTGKALDSIASLLGVRNNNNAAMEDDDKLRLINVDLGALLEHAPKFGDVAKDGDTIMLVRGLRLPTTA
ncbi:hypothetical protein SAICODRAFT_31232 [Saitoella complicata NRRL Y-17804]|uniref:AN1-type domain-containing protein n=1 Tax=Saitoella complicata (strain BCRC 22490 / CBS 7301 / JCM 7358 / NBRC 10748 / NRRL Y-17804) TaxID=698492 RepID=A0A0E9ND63_SAICN|nr:uncharacterized protein SAICODRAFT_31232 [Saitoella complicata NRRL Y-17804]ODQ51598.1 hypothetical protein SAICODRAFT_31232 [Saitoella complicata NRRL Y-17804]GAO47350.1 hypothetical protein G7K_1558-t1 [Saitoella complicata NRRL Y-17804]